MATCIAQLLQAYVYQQSFSAEAKGGGPESNMRLLLALVALGRYFVSCASPDDLQVGCCCSVDRQAVRQNLLPETLVLHSGKWVVPDPQLLRC